MSTNGLEIINTGVYPNDAKGDPLQTAFTKINYNFGVLAAGGGGGGSSGVETVADVSPSQGSVTNWLALQGAIDTVTAAGGGIVAIGGFSGPIPISSTISLGTSVAIGSGNADNPFNGVLIRGSGYTINENTQAADAGTVLQGTGAFPIFAYNATDNTVDYSGIGNLTSSYLQGLEISDLACDTCTYGIKIGALSKAGLNFAKMRHIYVSNYTAWAYWLENFQYIDIQELYGANQAAALGHAWFGGSFGSIINPGNATFRRIFLQQNITGVRTQRGIVIQQRTSAGGVVGSLNDINVYDLQSNLTDTATTQAATWSAGSPTVLSLAANIQNFPLDQPVTVTSSAGGLIQYQTYFVVTNSGGTGAGTIKLSNNQGGSALTLSAGVTLISYGCPPFEIVGYGNAGGNLVQPSGVTGIDLETHGNCALLLQNTNINIQVNDSFTGQGVSAASSIVARGSNGVVNFGPDEAILDYDSTSAQFLMTWGQLANDSGQIGLIQNNMPVIFGLDRNQAKGGFSLGGEPSNLKGLQMVASNGLGGQAFFMPQIAMGQRQIVDTFNGDNGYSGYYAGAITIRNQGQTNTKTLTTLSQSVETTTSGGAQEDADAGVPFLIFNATAYPQIIAANSGQYFNANFNLTSITIAPQGFIAVRAAYDATNGNYWVTEAMSPACGFNADPTVSLQSPSTGFSITPGAGILTLILTPSGTLAAGTVTMPANPIDNQELIVMSTHIVSTLTVSANAGQSIANAPTAFVANTSFGYRYNAANAYWYRLY